MILDLTYNGKLNKDASIILDSIANDKRAVFTKLIDDLSINFETNLDWHLTGPASRNTLLSPLFFYYCSYYLVDYFISNKKIYFINYY